MPQSSLAHIGHSAVPNVLAFTKRQRATHSEAAHV